jgi:hypothetical protein
LSVLASSFHCYIFVFFLREKNVNWGIT